MNAPVFEQIAIFVSARPDGVGRSDVAAQFSIHKNTALYHLEKCVERGLLRKVYTWISNRSRGWVYYPYPTDMTPMVGEDSYSSYSDSVTEGTS